MHLKRSYLFLNLTKKLLASLGDFLNTYVSLYYLQLVIQMIICLYDMFGTDTLRHRETARKVVELIEKDANDSSIVIDFSRIDFASRSFLHELLCDLGSRKVVFENRNNDVKQMMDIILKRAVSVNA